MRLLRHCTSQLLRQDNATDTGSVLWGCKDLSGSGSPAGSVQEVWESETGKTALAGKQSILYGSFFLLCGPEVPKHDHQGCGKRVETGLACGKGAGEGVHAGTASKESSSSASGNWDRRDIPEEGHTYRIVVSDLERGRTIWFGGEDRSEESMNMFYEWLGPKKTKKIQLAVMDMWKAFEKSTKENAHGAAILYDKFHVIRHLGDALDKVRKMEYSRLSGKDRSYIKGQKYTLLSNRENLTLDGRKALTKLVNITPKTTFPKGSALLFGHLSLFVRPH
jgi:hypothetical protein